MAYNTAIANALIHLEMQPTASTNPTAAQATIVWTQQYARLSNTLAAAGVSAIGTGTALTVAQDIEALCTSHRVGKLQETQAGGNISRKTEELKEECEELVEHYTSSAGVKELEAGGATVDRLEVRGLATEFPNSDLDTSTYKSPLGNDTWARRGGDL